jgi:predicted dehydrogenase
VNSLNFALIGCGRIAHRHADALTKNEKAKLVAVCDLLPERAREFKDKYGARDWCTEYRRVLERPDIDVVNICTPSGLHAQMGIEAAQAGKQVIIEKPMALSLHDADALIRACEDRGVLLAVCHQNRFNPAVTQLRRALDGGRFGKLTHGAAVVRWSRPQAYYDQASWRGTWAMDGGCLMNQSIHNIDLLQWMLGPVSSLFGYTARNLRNIEAEDLGEAILRFQSGALGMIEASNTIFPENLEETLSIFGEKGTVVLGGVAVNKIQEWKFGEVAGEASLKGQQEDVPNVYGFGHGALIEDLICAIRDCRRPFIDGREGRKALEIILAIYHSVRLKKEIDLPLKEEFYVYQ